MFVCVLKVSLQLNNLGIHFLPCSTGLMKACPQPSLFRSLPGKLGSKGFFLLFKMPLFIFRGLMFSFKLLDRKTLRLRHLPPVTRLRYKLLVLLFGRLQTFACQPSFFKKPVFFGFQFFHFFHYF